MNDVTRILSAIEQGDASAAQELLPLVYDELRKLAAQRMAREAPGHTLQPTALVHEAYARLVEAQQRGSSPRRWDGRGHFFAAAAEAIRRILVERARRKRRIRHGGGLRRLAEFDLDLAVAPDDDEQLLLLDDALTRLGALRPQAEQLVKLRFFSGLTVDDAATMLELSPRTARRLWVFARAWLRREMEQASAGTR